jgi:hypothetical protein
MLVLFKTSVALTDRAFSLYIYVLLAYWESELILKWGSMLFLVFSYQCITYVLFVNR